MPDVPAILKSLGTTSDEVADKLASEGCRGRISDDSDCPVANYMRNHGFKLPSVSNKIAFCEGTAYFLPLPVSDFILAFDMGYYSELVEA